MERPQASDYDILGINEGAIPGLFDFGAAEAEIRDTLAFVREKAEEAEQFREDAKDFAQEAEDYREAAERDAEQAEEFRNDAERSSDDIVEIKEKAEEVSSALDDLRRALG